MLAGENIGEFGKSMANYQSFLPQIIYIKYIHIYSILIVLFY